MEKNLLIFAAVVVIAAEDPDPLCLHIPDKSLYASPFSCSEYYNCTSGKLTLEQCPCGYLFSATDFECVEAEYAGCQDFMQIVSDSESSACPTSTTITTSTTTTTETTQSPITGPSVNVTCGAEISYFSLNTTCHFYGECYQGAAYKVECPKGFYYSDIRQKCVLAIESECCMKNTSLCVGIETPLQPVPPTVL